MDPLGVQGETKKKNKKKVSSKRGDPIKVVYIGDPKKVQASASDFRALVQELTGWNAASMPYVEEALDAHAEAQDPRVLPHHLASPEPQTSPDHGQPFTEYSHFSIESFNEYILQQMLDGSPLSEFQSCVYGLSSETCSP